MSFSPLLSLHIAAGMLGMLSGAVALYFRKGSPAMPSPEKSLSRRCSPWPPAPFTSPP